MIASRIARGLVIVAAFLAGAVVLATAADAGEIDWHGRVFVEIDSKSLLPDFISSQLAMDAGGEGNLADIGQRFSTGDVRDAPDWGLIGAAHDGSIWVAVVAINRNMQGVALRLYVFEGAQLISSNSAGYWSGSGVSLATVIAGMSQPLPILRTDSLLDHIVLGRGQSRVTRISDSGSRYCLGVVCPGDPLSMVEIALGAPLNRARATNGVNVYSLRPLAPASGLESDSDSAPSMCQADITVVESAVSTIKVSCLP